MNARSCCELLADMVAIPSPSRQEAVLARELHARLEALGFQAWLDSAGNVVGEIGSDTGPTILLLGHMDTVPKPLPTHTEGRILHGRGAVDAKGPLAAMICAAAARRDAPYRIRVVGAVEEETPSSRGAVEVTRSAPLDAVLIGEPTGWSDLVFGYKGKLDLTYRVERPQAHSSHPGEKASEAVVAFWERVLELLGPQGTAFGLPSATLSTIHGDLVVAEATVSCRLPVDFPVAGFLDELRSACGGGTVTVDNAVPAALTSRSDAVVRHLTNAIRRHGGRPRHLLRGGSSDMNTVRAVWDVPIATYGPGDHTLEHTDNEWIDLDEYLRSISVISTTLDGLAAELCETRG